MLTKSTNLKSLLFWWGPVNQVTLVKFVQCVQLIAWLYVDESMYESRQILVSYFDRGIGLLAQGELALFCRLSKRIVCQFFSLWSPKWQAGRNGTLKKMPYILASVCGFSSLQCPLRLSSYFFEGYLWGIRLFSQLFTLLVLNKCDQQHAQLLYPLNIISSCDKKYHVFQAIF